MSTPRPIRHPVTPRSAPLVLVKSAPEIQQPPRRSWWNGFAWGCVLGACLALWVTG